MATGAMVGLAGGAYLDLMLTNAAGGRWTLVHVMLAFIGILGGLALWDELRDGGYQRGLIRQSDAPMLPKWRQWRHCPPLSL
jgi:hypothetical protein